MSTTEQPQGDADDVTAAMARLEAALERIAVLSEQARAAPVAVPGSDSAELAHRLDGMIARLRQAIDE